MRYKLNTIHATTVVHNSKVGKRLTGNLPDLDPVITGGKASFNELEEGGLFWFNDDMVIEAISAGTWEIVSTANEESPIRPTPAAPFKLCHHECLRVKNVDKATCVARIDTIQVM